MRFTKKVIALDQTYFAIQTRKQELSGREYEELSTPNRSLKQIEKERKNQIKK